MCVAQIIAGAFLDLTQSVLEGVLVQMGKRCGLFQAAVGLFVKPDRRQDRFRLLFVQIREDRLQKVLYGRLREQRQQHAQFALIVDRRFFLCDAPAPLCRLPGLQIGGVEGREGAAGGADAPAGGDAPCLEVSTMFL